MTITRGSDFVANFGPQAAHLAELKLLSAGATWYHSGDKTVDVRARQLPRIYKEKAKVIDKTYCGTVEGQIGVVERRLEEFGTLAGFVVGQLGEASQDLHLFLKKCAKEKATKVANMTGHPLSISCESQILQQMRRRLSVCSIRAQSACLLSRLGHTGEGAKSAADRRIAVRVREELLKQDFRNHWEAHLRGRQPIQFGRLHL